MTWTTIDRTAVDGRPEVSRAAFGDPVVDNLNDLNTRVIANTSSLSTAVQNTRQIIAGTGLTGGGTFSADRTLAVSYGTAAGTAAQGNDSRITGAVQGTRQVLAGTGLTGGGDLTADRTLTVAYGNTSTTAATGARATALEAQTAMLQSYGRWNITDVSTHTPAAEPAKPFTAVGTPLSDVTVNSTTGAITVVNAGVYEFTVGWHCTFSLTLNTGFNTNVFLSDGTTTGTSITQVVMQQQGYQVQYVAGTLELSGILTSGPKAFTAGTVLYFHIGAAQNVVPTGSDGLGRNFIAVRRLS